MDVLSCAVPRISVAFALFFLATTLGTSIMIEVDDGKELRLQYIEYPEQSGSRRLLVGPGSSPPTCRARCGRCFPCRPVHVAIQPGRSVPMEYYPEAWRCKCGNKLFMP